MHLVAIADNNIGNIDIVPNTISSPHPTDNAGNMRAKHGTREPNALTPQFLRWIAATASCKTVMPNEAVTTSLNQRKRKDHHSDLALATNNAMIREKQIRF